jgi:hypothetical protein
VVLVALLLLLLLLPVVAAVPDGTRLLQLIGATVRRPPEAHARLPR